MTYEIFHKSQRRSPYYGLYCSESQRFPVQRQHRGKHTHESRVRAAAYVRSSPAGLLSSVQGHPTPSLTAAPSAITLLDIYKAVEGDKPLLHLDTHTNPECGVGIYIQLSLQDYFDRIQEDCGKRNEKDHSAGYP